MQRNVDIGLLKKEIRIRMKDGRSSLEGRLMCFDRHMNMFLDAAKEVRTKADGVKEVRNIEAVVLVKGALICDVTSLEELKQFDPRRRDPDRSMDRYNRRDSGSNRRDSGSNRRDSGSNRRESNRRESNRRESNRRESNRESNRRESNRDNEGAVRVKKEVDECKQQ